MNGYESLGIYTHPFFDKEKLEIRKEKENGLIVVSLNNMVSNKVCSYIKYVDIGEYVHPFLSWYNLFFCSNNYGSAPDYDYMHSAVQSGKKTAATIYISPNEEEGKKFISSLPEGIVAAPYDDSMIFACREGCLSDYFDFNAIRDIYISHGVSGIDWEIIEALFNLPMVDFADENKCGLNLQSGGHGDSIIALGLLLGYPVESTVACLQTHDDNYKIWLSK